MSPPKMTWEEREEKITNIIRPLIITDEMIEKIKSTFEEELELGLAKDPPRKSSLQMENTYIPELCNGQEEGEFLALDLGGTNFRVILLKLKPGSLPLERVKYYVVPENLRIGKGIPLFDFLASCIFDFMKFNNLLDKKLSLGFCFSFPMIQKSLKSGILVTWTKSFNCPDVVGKDAVEMLEAAIKKRKDIMVDVCAVVNDTTGTLMKGAYVDHQCAIGLILGTGCNACYLEKVSRIKKWVGKHHGIDEVVVDIEWGAFGDNGVLDFVKTEFDLLVDKESLLVGSFTFEKMFAGKFIGDLARHVILKMCRAGVFTKDGTCGMLELQNSLTAADVSSIICDEGEMLITMQILHRIGLNIDTIDEAEVVKQVCCIVSARGALLVSVCLSSLLKRINKEFVTIAIDGSLYKNHPFFHNLMTAYIRELAPEHEFRLVLAEDGSGKGAGLAAAVVNRLDASELLELHE